MNDNMSKITTMQGKKSATNAIDSIRSQMGIKHPDANKGRYGDSEIRPVDGKGSHVNAWEAFILDQTKQDGLGHVGEQFVKSVGSGTKNPNTGRDEYFMDMIMSGLQMAGQTGGIDPGAAGDMGLMDKGI